MMIERYNQPIVFLDSGIGGIPYLMEYYRQESHRRLIYVADQVHFPYGAKEGGALKAILHRTISMIIDQFNPALIVIACNTASVTALDWLRRRFSVQFVGIVPAVKPAALRAQTKNIGLLVTERTAVGEYLHDLIGQFVTDKHVVTVAASGLVSQIEASADALVIQHNDKIAAYIDDIVREFKAQQVDTVVLGCTHFIYVYDLLHRALGAAVKIVDSRVGVTKHIFKLGQQILSKPKHMMKSAQIAECYTTDEHHASESFLQLLIACNISFAGIVAHNDDMIQ